MDTLFKLKTLEELLLTFSPQNINSISKSGNVVSPESLQSDIAFMLTKIFNNWLREESVPRYILTSRIVLLYKQGKLEEGNFLDDFRPISVTSYLFKILETMIKKRI